MSSNPVQFDRRGAVGLIRLNRIEVHNVVNDAVMSRLESILGQLNDDAEIRTLIFTGAGRRTFSAGGDLDYFSTLTAPGAGTEMSRRMQAILRRLADGPRAVIAAVNGDALGGGCEILTACHLRIAASHARFSFRQAAMGLITGWGGGLRLFRLVGRSNALRVLLTAETLDAAEALRIGLVDRVVEAQDLEEEAFALAGQIAANSQESVQAFLDLARAVDRAGNDRATARETDLFGRCWEGEDFRRRLSEWRRDREGRKGGK